MDLLALEQKALSKLTVPDGYKGPVHVYFGKALFAKCKDADQAISVMIGVLENNPNAPLSAEAPEGMA